MLISHRQSSISHCRPLSATFTPNKRAVPVPENTKVENRANPPPHLLPPLARKHSSQGRHAALQAPLRVRRSRCCCRVRHELCRPVKSISLHKAAAHLPVTLIGHPAGSGSGSDRPPREQTRTILHGACSSNTATIMATTALSPASCVPYQTCSCKSGQRLKAGRRPEDAPRTACALSNPCKSTTCPLST